MVLGGLPDLADRSGNLKFLKRLEGAGTNYVDGVAATSSFIAISGIASSDLGDGYQGASDAFVARLDKKGAVSWWRDIGTSGYDEGFGVDINSAGEIFTAGIAYGTFPDETVTAGRDAFVAKYSKTGTRLWLRSLSTNNDKNFDVAGLAVTDKGGVVLSATTRGTITGHVNAGNHDLVAVRYDKSGAVLWSQEVGSAGDDFGWGIAIKKNLLYLSAGTEGSWSGFTNQGDSDLLLVKLNATSGDVLLHRQMGTSAEDGNGNFGEPLAIASNGSVLMGGTTRGALLGFTKPGSPTDIDAILVQIAL